MTKHSKYYYDYTRNGRVVEESTVPEYYIGKTHKYEASKVIEDFQADNYNIGVAIAYLLRAGKKNDNPVEQELRKAIDHLNFELNRINADKGKEYEYTEAATSTNKA